MKESEGSCLMSPDPIVELTFSDCELLNRALIPYEEIQFLDPRSNDANPTFVDDGQKAIPIFEYDGRAIYRAVFNRLPVMVKEVRLRTSQVLGEADSKLNSFAPGTGIPLTQHEQLSEAIVGLGLPRHRNLCQVFAWARSPKPNHFLIVTERFDDDLDHYMCKIFQKMTRNGVQCSPGEGGPLGWEQFFLVATELASALERMAKLNREHYVVHRDLKLSNLFIALDDKTQEDCYGMKSSRIERVVLGDFGVSRMENLEQPPQFPVTRMVGTMGYQPPEVIDPGRFNLPGGPDERLTTKLDVFSYGMILWRMLHYPRFPWFEFEGAYKTSVSFQMAVAEGKMELPFDPSVPDDLKDVIVRCCQHNPSSRPTAEEIRRALLAITKNANDYFKERTLCSADRSKADCSVAVRDCTSIEQGFFGTWSAREREVDFGFVDTLSRSDGITSEGHSPNSSKLELEIASAHPHSMESIELGAEVGWGSYGEVREMSSSHSEKACVVKRIANASNVFHSLDDLHRHVDILNDTQLHPNIVQTERIIFDDNRDELYNVMERMDGCLKVPGTVVEPPERLAPCLAAIVLLVIARDVLKALRHLEQKKIVHGDLKPENILNKKTEGPEEEWTYKLADFDGAVKVTDCNEGDTKRWESESKFSTMYTVVYASRERLKGENDYPFAGDIWSLGVTLHVLRHGRFPFPPWKTNFQLERSIMEGKLELSALQSDDADEMVLHGLIVDMLTLDPAQRLTATALLNKCSPEPFP